MTKRRFLQNVPLIVLTIAKVLLAVCQMVQSEKKESFTTLLKL